MTPHPALILFATAGLVGLSRGRARAAVLLAGTVAALVAAASLPHGAHWEYGVGDYQLQLLRVDTLSHLFGLIFTVAMVQAWSNRLRTSAASAVFSRRSRHSARPCSDQPLPGCRFRSWR